MSVALTVSTTSTLNEHRFICSCNPNRLDPLPAITFHAFMVKLDGLVARLQPCSKIPPLLPVIAQLGRDRSHASTTSSSNPPHPNILCSANKVKSHRTFVKINQYAMTTPTPPLSPQPTIYPDYCHVLSPTISRWVPLRGVDIHSLQSVGLYIDGTMPFFPGPQYHSNSHPFCGD